MPLTGRPIRAATARERSPHRHSEIKRSLTAAARIDGTRQSRDREGAFAVQAPGDQALPNGRGSDWCRVRIGVTVRDLPDHLCLLRMPPPRQRIRLRRSRAQCAWNPHFGGVSSARRCRGATHGSVSLSPGPDPARRRIGSDSGGVSASRLGSDGGSCA